MADLHSGNSFTTNKTKYLFMATLWTAAANDNSKTFHLTLDIKDLVSFDYEEELNKLVITGSLVYKDGYGLIDRFLEADYSFVDIDITEYDKKEVPDPNQPGAMIEKEVATDTYFILTFFIRNILVLNREHNVITYKLNLVSDNWFNCLTTLSYTNYDKSPEPIFEIFKNLIVASLLKVNPATFDIVKTNVKTNYLTHSNENLFTATDYLFSKLFYRDDAQDDVMKFFWYNDYTYKYNLLNIKDDRTFVSIKKNILLSFFKSSTEQYAEPVKPNFATVVKTPATHTFRSMWPLTMNTYDYDKNTFDKKEFKTDQLLNYHREHFDSGAKKVFRKYNTYEKMLPTEKNTLKFKTNGTYWNNSWNYYKSWCDTYFLNNSLVINAIGELTIRPSSLVHVMVDRDVSLIPEANEKISEAKRMKAMYLSYEGHWFTAKVHNFIEPLKLLFTLNVVLFRNFTNFDASITAN